MTTNVLKLFRNDKKVGQIEPTDNHVDQFIYFLTRLIEHLEFHAKVGFATRSVRDRVQIGNCITRAAYTSILLYNMKVMDPDQISSDYDMSSQMTRIMDLTVEDVNDNTQKPLSISMVVEIDRILQSMIDIYYCNQYNRPWWKFWG